MARARVEMAARLSVGELQARARARKGVDSKETRRWQALWLFSQGQSTQQVSGTCGLSESWVREIIRRYNVQGAAGVEDGHMHQPIGPRSLLNAGQRLALAAAVKQVTRGIMLALVMDVLPVLSPPGNARDMVASSGSAAPVIWLAQRSLETWWDVRHAPSR